MVRDDLQRGAGDEADAGGSEPDLDQALLVAAHHGGDEEQDDGNRHEPERAIEELEATR